MAKEIRTEGRSYQEVKENRGVLKRAYELHFRRGLTWAAVERELGLKIAGGMTALNCAERYIDVTDDPRVRADGKEWRRKRKVALAVRKKQKVVSIATEKLSPTVPPPEQHLPLTLEQVDERLEKRLREFAGNLAQAINMAAG